MLAVGDLGYDAWIAKLRACTLAEVGGAKPHLPGTRAELERKPAVSIEGRLLPKNVECTLMGCTPGPCCNGCGFEWVVVPRRDCPGRGVRIRLPGSPFPLLGGGRDCAVSGFAAEADWVIVSGRIGGKGDIVVDADLCRLPSPAALETRDRLSDDDYERLTSPQTKARSRKAKDELNCPSLPAPPPPRPPPAPRQTTPVEDQLY